MAKRYESRNLFMSVYSRFSLTDDKMQRREHRSKMSDLQILDAQLEVYPVHFEHVPGHAGVHGNEMADQLARHAVQEVR